MGGDGGGGGGGGGAAIIASNAGKITIGGTLDVLGGAPGATGRGYLSAGPSPLTASFGGAGGAGGHPEEKGKRGRESFLIDGQPGAR